MKKELVEAVKKNNVDQDGNVEGLKSRDMSWQEFLSHGKSDNTFRSYQGDIKHFEEWGGLLPASPKIVGEYLKFFADQLAVSTLNRRVAALAYWHKLHKFPDPTDNAFVKEVMKSIRKQYNKPPEQARPLTYDELGQVVSYLDKKIQEAGDAGLITASQEKQWLIAHRDKAMVLVGFWRGFRADTLFGLKLENIKQTTIRLPKGQSVPGLEIFLPASKGDREARGEFFQVPAMPNQLCPVTAYSSWLASAGLSNSSGVAFRSFNRQGNLIEKAMAPSGAANWFKRLCGASGLVNAKEFSSHSMRRGVANYIVDKGGDIRDLMDYIGWKSTDTAFKYVEKGSKASAILLS